MTIKAEYGGTRDVGVFTAAHDGLHRFDPDGKPRLPEVVSNLTFGGVKRNQLFITASTSVYAQRVNFHGASPRTANTR